jgi:hypothetical protein
MDTHTKIVSALLSAMALARQHGGAEIACQAAGIALDEAGRVNVVSADLESVLAAETVADRAREALAVGFLAGQVAHGPAGGRACDPTSFLMDHNLLVRAADGESIMRLPWFEEDLFVGRQLPDISEMPSGVRELAVGNYRRALEGERRSFDFTSYGHSYHVEAVPVLGEDGVGNAVLAIATPATRTALAADACLVTAQRLERSASRRGARRAALRRRSRSR